MKKMLQKKIMPFWLGTIIVITLAIPAVVLSINSIADGWRLNAGVVEDPLIFYNYEGDCYTATNSNVAQGAAYFVPTGAELAGGDGELEWQAFKSFSDIPNDAIEVYPCSLPNTECRLHYQYKIDNKIGQIKTTPWTDNTSSYKTGPYSLVKTGKDDHCNGSQACGIRVGVQCRGDYGINVQYEMIFPDNGVRRSGGIKNTGFADTSTQAISWGTFSQRQYEDGDNECKSSGGSCEIKMTVTDNFDGPQAVSCDIGYQHRTDESTSGWEYNGASALANNDGSGDGENCEKSSGGCGLQARLRCQGPPAGIGSPPSPASGTVNGECGPDDGQVFFGPLQGSGAPSPSRECSVGTSSGASYNGSTGEWQWSCTSTGAPDLCTAYNINFGEWNPSSDPGGGGPGSCNNSGVPTICDDTLEP